MDTDINELIADSYALVRESSKRIIGLRHYDVQLMGGIVLHQGKISEMKTGEGKTLVATLPTYLNAVMQNKAVVVTVNDYLAKRDAEWMRPVYEFLGLTVGVVISNQDNIEKKTAYASDVIYATNNELGFDYLRDNMAHLEEQKVQCSLDFAIVDGRARTECCHEILPKIKKGGILILDNSERKRYKLVFEQLKKYEMYETTNGLTNTTFWFIPA